MTYKIEKGLAFKVEPDIERPKKKQNSYPFKKMKVNDSFIIRENYSRTLMQGALGAANAWNNKCNGKKWKFSVRKVNEGGQDKIRLWRIK